MIKIKSIQNQLTKAGFLTASKIDITILSGKLGDPLGFYYKILAEKEAENDNITDFLVVEDNLYMTKDDYEKWDNTDDTYAENWVLKKLNLERLI